MLMRRALKLVLFLFVAVLLIAADLQNADPAWKQKPLREWNEEDAKLVLTDSPWVKFVSPERVRYLSPFERRDGGDFEAGAGEGIGLAGTGLLGANRAAAAIRRAHAQPALPPVTIRWESALPVRMAEQKAAEKGFPDLDSDDYAIVIYGMPTPGGWNLARELKGVASLKRNKRKDLKPTRVRIFREDEGDETATLTYLFPRSAEITRKDGPVLFTAQVGRLVVSQYFFPEDMQLRGEPQLLMPTSGKP